MKSAVVSLAAASLLLTAAAPSPLPPPTIDPADRAVCAMIAATAPAALAPRLTRTAALDLDGDGSPEQLSVVEGGTAHVESYQIARADGADVTLTTADAGYGDGAFFDGGVRWLVQEGRAYVLVFAGRGQGYLAYVQRITGDLREQPVCRFRPSVAVRLAPVAARDAAACDAIRAGRVSYARVGKFAQPQGDPRFDAPGGPASLVGKAVVDWANTGHPGAVYAGEILSSAGGGCTLSYFDTREGHTPDRMRLMALQHMDVTDAFPRRTCRDAQTRWLTFRGRTYLETRSTAAEAPHGEDFEYREVTMLQGGRARTVCQARYDHRPPTVDAWWTGEGWSAPMPTSE
jgi:hypothetical protein